MYVGKEMLEKYLKVKERMSKNLRELFEEMVNVDVNKDMDEFDVRKNEIVKNEIMKMRESKKIIKSVLE